jgi:5-hydroxyisourate hydrolase-like protein (transthyretin family)
LTHQNPSRLARAVITTIAVPAALLSPSLTSHAEAATPGDISGHVVVNGGPANDGYTYVYLRSTDGNIYQQVQTDSSGDYDFGSLPPGGYTVQAEDYNYYTYYYYGCYTTDGYASCAQVNVHAGETVSGVDIDLTPNAQRGQLSGTVTDTSGDPVSTDVEIFRKTPYGWQLYTDTTSYVGDGSYSSVLAPGTYRVEFGTPNNYYAPEFWQNATDLADATDIVVTADAQSTADAVMRPAAEITGHVTDAGGPAANVRVDVYRKVDGAWTSVASHATDANGAYDIWGLPAATYRVGYSDPEGTDVSEFWNDAATIAGASDITLGDEQSAVADAQLATSGAISGVLTGPDGLGASYLDVTAYRQTQDGWKIASQASSSQSGAYTLTGLAAGTYRIGFRDASGQDATEYWDDATTIAGATDVVVTSGSTTTQKDATLAANTGTSDAVFNTSVPTIVGTPKVGRTLTSTPGSWTPNGVSFSYQWTANGSPIAGATGATYRAHPAVVGKTIALQVSGLRSGYPSGSATSASTAPVAKGTLTLRKAPVVKGDATVGQVLRATSGTWKQQSIRTSYQWLAGGKKIAHATMARLKVTHSLKGKRISVQVTARKTGYSAASVTSKATRPVTGRAMHRSQVPAA